ncbi:hypothetical protein H4S08_003505 [Coemansia sp. RSA 1365]|nr:hypothetical protein H4S08_003505 [Coemansia sp. RSA 1365]
MNDPSIRIGVLGEFGVGKSELVHRICHPTAAGPSAVSSMSGPTVDILSFDRPNGRGHAWVEFIIIPSETRHPRSRQMVYSVGLDALILVCNCAVNRTLLRVTEWMEEVTANGRLRGVSVALVLGGPDYVDLDSNTTLTRIIEPLVEAYRARVVNLSGYTSTVALEPRQRNMIYEFFEAAMQRKETNQERFGDVPRTRT